MDIIDRILTIFGYRVISKERYEFLDHYEGIHGRVYTRKEVDKFMDKVIGK